MTDTITVPPVDEPTIEMIDAGLAAAQKYMHEQPLTYSPHVATKLMYQAMLAAAPRPDDELARLEREIAIKWCRRAFMRRTQPANGLWRIERDDRIYWYAEEWKFLQRTGLLEHHPDHPGWVRVKE